MKEAVFSLWKWQVPPSVLKKVSIRETRQNVNKVSWHILRNYKFVSKVFVALKSTIYITELGLVGVYSVYRAVRTVFYVENLQTHTKSDAGTDANTNAGSIT